MQNWFSKNTFAAKTHKEIHHPGHFDLGFADFGLRI
jgi:hypothetical protein